MLCAASAVPRDRWTEHPTPDEWSVVELLEHLYKVEHGCARLIAKGVANAQLGATAR